MAYLELTSRSGGSNLYAGTLDGVAEASTTPLVSYTNGGWNSATGVFTPTSGNPSATGVSVGHWVSVYTDGASAPTGFIARVTAVSTTTMTLSTTAKSGTAPTTAGTGITAVVGGAHAGPSAASSFPIGFVQNTMVNTSNNYPRINLKNDQTYNVTAAMTQGNAGIIAIQGYGTTFGDKAKTIIDGGSSGVAYTVLSATGTRTMLRDLIFNGNGATSAAELVQVTGNGSLVERCVFRNCRYRGLYISVGFVEVIQCEAYNCNANGSPNGAGFGSANNQRADASFDRCYSYGNAGVNSDGFYIAGSAVLRDCYAIGNGAIGFRLSNATNTMTMSGCVAYGNTSHGANVSTSQMLIAENCKFISNTGTGVAVGSTGFAVLRNCVVFGNGAAITGQYDEVDPVTINGDPFVSPGTGDFRLSNTADGLALAGTGAGSFEQAASGHSGLVSYPDIGGAQRREPRGQRVNGC